MAESRASFLHELLTCSIDERLTITLVIEFKAVIMLKFYAQIELEVKLKAEFNFVKKVIMMVAILQFFVLLFTM